MSKFNLTAQIQLQAPKNAKQVVNQIQQQLTGATVNLSVKNGPQATKQVNNLTKATQQANTAAGKLGKTLTASIKAYAGMAIATRAVSLFTNTLGSAIQEAIDFERELVKVVQVTGKSIKELRGLTNEITRLATAFGASSTSLVNVTRILSQAGLSANETRIALDALARSTLAPTFDDIASTAEGAVAIFNQFRQGAEALEKQLGAINAVAGQFAVEAGDLIAVIRRTGGVFKAAGGDLNELIALFTSVRSTTRESAESIATGLRTIFTRIQRPKTIEFLRQYGIELTDLNGKFVGPFEATKRLSAALAGLEQGDLSFIEIAEELGGFRQIGKVIPLIQEFRISQEALNVAIAGGDSLTKDAATAQQALAVRIAKVKEEFLALVRSISESTSFQLFANAALNIASALIKVGDALKPLIPLITAFAAIRIAKGVAGVAGGLMGFNRGGMVPGSGNTDTVPAMLTPGEFVVRKSAVSKIGASNLASINKYAYGGKVQGAASFNSYGLSVQDLKDKRKKVPKALGNAARGSLLGNMFEGFLAEKYGISSQTQKFPDAINADRDPKVLRATGPLAQGVKHVEFKYKADLERSAKYAGKYNKKNTDVYSAFNKGGPVGTDTVPALLTPGEFVINKKSAQSFGYGNLKRVNKYAKGGKVQRFNTGGAVGGGMGGAVAAIAGVQALTSTFSEADSALNKVIGVLSTVSLNFVMMSSVLKAASSEIQKFSLKAANKKLTAALTNAGSTVKDKITNMVSPVGSALSALAKRFKDTKFVQNFKTGAGERADRTRQLQSIRKANPMVPGAPFQTDRKLMRQQDVNVTRGKGIGGAAGRGFEKATRVAATGVKVFQNAVSKAGSNIKNSKVGVQLRAIGIQSKRLANNLAQTSIGRGAGAVAGGAARIAGGAGRAVAGLPKGVMKAVGASIISLKNNFDSISSNALGAATTFALINGVISQFLTTTEDYKSAVEDGNVALAGELAVRKQAEGDIDAFGGIASGAAAAVATAFLGPQMGQLVGQLTAFSIGILKLIPGFELLTGGIRDGLSVLTGGWVNSTANARAFGEVAAMAAVSTKSLAEAQEKSIEAQAKFQSGDMSATEALNTAYGQAASDIQAERKKISQGNLSEKDKKKAEKEVSGREQSLIKDSKPLVNNIQRQIAASGGTFADFLAALPADLRKAYLNQGVGDLQKGFDGMKSEMEKSKEAMAAWNVGLNNITAAADAGAVGLDRFLAQQELGYNALGSSIGTLEASITSAAMGMSSADMASATKQATDAMLALGASETQVEKFEQNIRAVQQAQKKLPESVDALRTNLQARKDRGELTDASGKANQAAIAETIANGLVGVDDETKKRLKSQIETMDISPENLKKIMEGDFDAISEVLGEIGDNALQQVLPALKKQAEIQSKLNKLTQQRLQLENQYINAQKKSLDVQLEVAEILAKHGGAAVTSEDRMRNVAAQGNLDSRAIGGISDLQTGSGAEFRQRAEESRKELESIQTQRQLAASGATTGVSDQAGVALAEKEKRLMKFQEQEAERIREAIKTREHELEMIKARNSEEKKGLQSLLDGDFESFFDSQAAVGATAALATGNQQLMGAFGNTGMAGAFNNIQSMQEAGVNTAFGQQIGGSGGLLERSAGAALGTFGMEDRAGVLAGTTQEEQAIQAEITELAPTLQTLADTTASNAESQMEAASLQMRAAEAQLKAAGEEVDSSMQAGNMARGGVVYASRGVFVPRGTDTVPAMLTPGEFVVRKSAVRRGNNLSLLKAMNNGGASDSAAQSLASGGVVRYLQNGGEVGGGVGVSPEVLNNFASALNNFNSQLAQNITNLQNTKFQVTLNPTSININLTGTAFLQNLTSKLKEELFNFVGQEISQYSVGGNGKLTKDSMGV